MELHYDEWFFCTSLIDGSGLGFVCIIYPLLCHVVAERFVNRAWGYVDTSSPRTSKFAVLYHTGFHNFLPGMLSSGKVRALSAIFIWIEGSRAEQLLTDWLQKFWLWGLSRSRRSRVSAWSILPPRVQEASLGNSITPPNDNVMCSCTINYFRNTDN